MGMDCISSTHRRSMYLQSGWVHTPLSEDKSWHHIDSSARFLSTRSPYRRGNLIVIDSWSRFLSTQDPHGYVIDVTSETSQKHLLVYNKHVKILASNEKSIFCIVYHKQMKTFYHWQTMFYTVWSICLFLHLANSLWLGDATWWHRFESTLAQVMAWCHNLNHYWLFMSKVQWQLCEGNFIRNTLAMNQFEISWKDMPSFGQCTMIHVIFAAPNKLMDAGT